MAIATTTAATAAQTPGGPEGGATNGATTSAPMQGTAGPATTAATNQAVASSGFSKSPHMYELKVESDTDADYDDNDRELAALLDGHGDEDSLTIDAEDVKKLNVVIRAFAPDLLRMRLPQAPSTPAADPVEPRRRGAERRARASDTLDDLLFTPNLTVRKLREHFHKLQAPLVSPAALRAHMSGSHVHPSRETLDADRRRLAAISTCLALVDEIARRSRDKWRKTTPRPIVEKITAPASSDDQPNRKRARIQHARRGSGEDVYALHMRLPGGDYFTNAVNLTANEASELDTAYADLVSVQAEPVVPQHTPIPTLGERLRGAFNARSDLLSVPGSGKRRDDDEYAKPVSHLYYGPWTSSSGPTYDSFDGQLNYRASGALWRAKRQDRMALHHVAKAKPSLLGLHARDHLEATLEEIFGDENDDASMPPPAIDIDAILSAYDDLPDTDLKSMANTAATDGIDACLQQNAILLHWLQQLQEQRWHLLLAKSATKKVNGAGDVSLSQPDSNETAIAGRLLDSLTTLLSAQPHVDATEGTSLRTVVPAADQLQSIATSAVVDPALLDGNRSGSSGDATWGTLDETLFGPSATRRQALVRSSASIARPPSAVRDNETLRLTKESEEKATSQTITLAGSALGSDRDRGKGLLDRFAASRVYTLDDHPHDRKPPVPPPAALPPQHPHQHPQLPQQHLRVGPGSPSVPRPGPGRPPYVPSRQSSGSGAMSYAGPGGQTMYRPAGGASPQQQQQPQHGGPLYRPPHATAGMAASPHYR